MSDEIKDYLPRGIVLAYCSSQKYVGCEGVVSGRFRRAGLTRPLYDIFHTFSRRFSPTLCFSQKNSLPLQPDKNVNNS
jgi:hypothetical protein